MVTYLNHVALNVVDYEWYKNFFETVCDMKAYREQGVTPNRKCWYVEGIQLNEALEDGIPVAAFSHLGLLTENVAELIDAAVAAGCTRIEGKGHWFRLPDGVEVEVKVIGSVPEVK